MVVWLPSKALVDKPSRMERNTHDFTNIEGGTQQTTGRSVSVGTAVNKAEGQQQRQHINNAAQRIKQLITTFVVLAKKFDKIYVYRFNKAKSLWLLSPSNPIRRVSIAIVTNQFFELFILLTILVNCVTLALDNPPEAAEYVFNGIYTAEMIVKIFAKGFLLHRFAYLRDPWSWLDFAVVCLGYITLAPDVENLSGIRTFRVLRALRTISAVEGLKTMVNALLKSMRMLTDVLVLTVFFLCVFALIGMQFFAGNLRRKCVSQSMGHSGNTSWEERISNPDHWYRINDVPILCGNSSTARHCPLNFTCLDDAGPNPNHGYSNFDHFGWALISSLQIVTMDFWEDIYLNVISSSSSWAILYFMMVIFFGSFYLINLVLAVVAISYQQETINSINTMSEYDQIKSIASSYSLKGCVAPRFLDEDEEYALSQGDPERINSGPMVVMIDIKKMAETTDETVSPTTQVSPGVSPSNRSIPPMPYATMSISQMNKFQRMRRFLHHLITMPIFDAIVTSFIFVNTVCLALEHPGMDVNTKGALETMGHVSTLIFLIEMVIKLLAMTPLVYVKNRWNAFDGLVVTISVIDWIVENATSASSTVGITVLRSFRLLRVLKIAQSWSTMRVLLSAIGRSLGALSNLTLILAIVVYMFAVVGRQLYRFLYTAEKFPNGEVPRWNFNTFGHSFMMIFRVLCGEWIEPLYDNMLVGGLSSLAFFLPALVLGNFLVLNLFLALLLNSFADQTFDDEMNKRKVTSIGRWKSGLSKIRHLFKLQDLITSKARIAPTKDSQDKQYTMSPNNAYEERQLKTSTQEGTSKSPSLLQLTASMIAAKHNAQSEGNDVMDRSKPSTNQMLENQPSFTIAAADSEVALDPCFPMFCYPMKKQEHQVKRKASLVCAGWETTRLFCKRVVDCKRFDQIFLALIIASSVILVFEDVHLASRPGLENTLNICNLVFTFIFFVEFTMKAIGLGIYPYLKNPWNCLDFFIVIISVIGVVGEYSNNGGNLSALRSIRTLRALRPLRAISKWDSMKIVVNCLLQAIPSIGNVLLVCLMFWLIFSIMGVQYFGGKFYKCLDEGGSVLSASIVPNKTACIRHGYRWQNSNVNFDNSINGFLALFQVATFEGWMEVMRDAVDSTDIDSQPSPNNNFMAYIYFVVFIIVGSFFILNLFITVIIDSFYKLKKQYDDCDSGGLFLTPSQKKWFNTLRKAVGRKPQRSLAKPKSELRAKLFHLVVSPHFEAIVMCLILGNVAVMTVSHYKQPVSFTVALGWVNVAFTTIFTVEMAVRITALSTQYFKDPWNVFDCLVVVLSITGIVLESLDVRIIVTPSIVRVIRLLRIGRLLRYIKSAGGIRKLLVALLISLPSLFNIGSLLFLILFIYSVMGMSLFGHVKHQGTINDIVNFETFGSSMMLLFRLATSAGWNDVLDSLMVRPPDCDENSGGLSNGNCGSIFVPILYFVTFILISFMIIVNMYIAIILENFTAAYNDEEIGVTDDDIESFYQHWQRYDPHASQYIAYNQLSDLVAGLDHPLRITKPNAVACSKLNIPMMHGDRIHCIDVLRALLHHVAGTDEEHSNEDSVTLAKTLEDRLLQSFPSRANQNVVTTTQERMQEIRAALVIQRHFAEWKKVRKQRMERDSRNTVKD